MPVRLIQADLSLTKTVDTETPRVGETVVNRLEAEAGVRWRKCVWSSSPPQD